MNVDFAEQDIIIEFTPEGQDGRSVRPKGEWSATAQYVELDLVGYHGNSYIALSTVPVGTLPTDTEYWMTNASNETPYWGNIEGTLSEQTDLQNALDAKADADEVYTKTETDDLLALKADADDVYTKAEADLLLADKADASSVYTKTETDSLLSAKADADDVYTKAETDSLLSNKADADDVYTKSQVYTKSETDDLLSTKANTADLGTLAGMNSIDYTSNYLTNKPTLGSLADQDTVDYATEVTNKPTLGDLSALNSIDYTSNYLTNKPTLGSLADQDTVDYETEVTNKPTLGTMSAESASDYYDKTEINDLINNSGVVAELDASGSIATFETNLAENLSRLNVSIDPVQDLHGYDAPWPAGGGKNKAPITEGNVTVGSYSWHVDSDGYITQTSESDARNWVYSESQWFITLPAGTYKLLCQSKTYAGTAISVILYDSSNNAKTSVGLTAVETKSSTFTLAEETALGIYGKNQGGIYRVAIYSDTSISTYQPYANVCPINGHSSAVVTRTGKNLWSLESQYDCLEGAFFINNVNFSLSAGTYTYTYTPSTTTGATTLTFLDSDGNTIYTNGGISNSVAKITFTLTKDASKIRCYSNTALTISNFQIEVGSEETSYESPHIQTVTIALGDTYYGAQLDAVAGTLTVTNKIVDLGDYDWVYNVGGRFSASDYDNVSLKDAKHFTNTEVADILCSQYAVSSRNGLTSYHVSLHYAGTSNYVNVLDSSYTDAQTFKTAMDGVQLVYPLETPTTVSLTPAQIQALVGKNYVWADTGDVAVFYFNNNTAEAITDVKQMIASTETSMTATRNYTSGSLIIVGSAMYKALSNIASGSTLIIGSNVQRTTLEEWILALLA